MCGEACGECVCGAYGVCVCGTCGESVCGGHVEVCVCVGHVERVCVNEKYVCGYFVTFEIFRRNL